MVPADNATPSLGEDQLHNWKLPEQFQRRLAPRLACAGASAAADQQLTASDYLSFQLFALLNPALKRARRLCVARRFKRVQQEVCRQPGKLTSFSEMQHGADPELLAGLLRDLGTKARPTFGDARRRAQVGDLIAPAGTLLPALPRRAWALWQNPQNRAGKLHLKFTVTPANPCERRVWKSKLRKGVCYVNDRTYRHDSRLLQTVQAREASFGLRLPHKGRDGKTQSRPPARRRRPTSRWGGWRPCASASAGNPTARWADGSKWNPAGPASCSSPTGTIWPPSWCR